MKVSSRGYGDAVRGLSHGKGAKVSVGRGTPAKREGSDGDLTLRNTNRGVILYAKYGGSWYSIHTQQSLSAGMIIMWGGATNTIPDGWALCNGNNGTPDLRCRFILSSGSGSASAGSYRGLTATVAASTTASAINIPSTATTATLTASGTESHTLVTSEIPAHTHNYEKSNNHPEMDPSVVGVSVADDADTTTATSSTGGGGGHTHGIKAQPIAANTTVIGTSDLPQVDYYVLAFIMFMGTGSEPGTEGYNWGGGSGELGRE